MTLSSEAFLKSIADESAAGDRQMAVRFERVAKDFARDDQPCRAVVSLSVRTFDTDEPGSEGAMSGTG